MKKLIITNSILLFLVVGIFIFGYYFINYPANFNLVQLIEGAEWKIFGLIILTIFISSAVLGFFPIRTYRFRNRFLTIFAGLNVLLLSFLILKALNSFFKNKKDLDHLIYDYQKRAEDDMKAGLMTIEYGGGYLMPFDQKTQKMYDEIDRMNRTYGLTYRNSGCIVTAALTKAQKEYIKYTKPYLDKRNGPDWEVRIKKQREEIQNRYR